MPAPQAEQLSFDWLLGSQEWFSPLELAERLGMKRRFVEMAYESGALSGQGHKSDLENGKRPTIKIHRSWVCAYLIRTANYDHEMKLQMGLDVLAAFDKPDLIRLRNRIDFLLTQ